MEAQRTPRVEPVPITLGANAGKPNKGREVRKIAEGIGGRFPGGRKEGKCALNGG